MVATAGKIAGVVPAVAGLGMIAGSAWARPTWTALEWGQLVEEESLQSRELTTGWRIEVGL